MNDFNQQVIAEFRANTGVVGGPFEGQQMVLLTTTGRRTGQQRTTPLVYSVDDGRYVIAASNGGGDTDPLWFLNLEAEPTAKIEVGDKSMTARAAVASPSERDRLYAAHAELMPGFLEYEKATDRTIPVVLLEPLAPDLP